MSECQLMQIPDAIYLLMQNTQLVTCDLSNNVISKLPVKFTERFPSITGKYISCLDLGRGMKITKLIVLIVSYVDSRVNLCVGLRYLLYIILQWTLLEHKQCNAMQLMTNKIIIFCKE